MPQGSSSDTQAAQVSSNMHTDTYPPVTGGPVTQPGLHLQDDIHSYTGASWTSHQTPVIICPLWGRHIPRMPALHGAVVHGQLEEETPLLPPEGPPASRSAFTGAFPQDRACFGQWLSSISGAG